MAAPTSRSVPNSPNPSVQGSPRSKGWSNLRTGEPGSAFRGISRARGSRSGGVKGGRGGGRRPTSSGQRGDDQPDTVNSAPSPSLKASSISSKSLMSISTTVTQNGVSGKTVNGTAERSGRSKPRGVPAVVVAPPSPSETPQTAPPTPSRSNRRRRQSGKGTTTASKPLLSAPKAQKSRGCSTPASQTIIHKDIPPHLVAAHEAEIRHDIDVLVERVRAVAMAENRPTTPGSHIDWAGDEDDSLPDLDDWGVTTTYISTTRDEDQSAEISPILADTLKPLPEPNSEVHQEEREMETYDARYKQVEEPPFLPTFLSNPAQRVVVPPSANEPPEPCIIRLTGVEESSSPTPPDGRPPLHRFPLPRLVGDMETSRARGSSVSKPSDIPLELPMSVVEEAHTTKTEGLSESIHALSADEHLALERVSSAPSIDRGLTTSIHAPAPALPESHSAPNLLSNYSTSAMPRTHSRSQTEGRSGVHQSNASHRRGRSGASSPLGKHVYTHVRNHSTPAGSAGSRPPHVSRPVITGEAISKLARTIGGLGSATRTQAVPVTKDSTVSS